MDYMVYVAIVYYLITEIGGRIVEYNSGLKKVAGSWQLSRNSNWTLSNDFKIQIIYYLGSGGHGGNGGYGVHGNQRKLWRIYINAPALSGRHIGRLGRHHAERYMSVWRCKMIAKWLVRMCEPLTSLRLGFESVQWAGKEVEQFVPLWFSIASSQKVQVSSYKYKIATASRNKSEK